MSEISLGADDVLVASAGDLCEGARWDARTGRLLFVDILAGLIHHVDPVTGERERWNVGMPVSVLAPRVSGGWVAAVERGFVFLDEDGRPTSSVLAVPGQPAHTRFNDGGCDPQGRFWAGTLHYDGRPGVASLYRLDPSGEVFEVLTEVTNSNGLAWSADGTTAYYVDTGCGSLDTFRFEAERGTLSDRRTLVAVPANEGLPDGLALDRDGFVWLALWDGWSVRRYAPDGRLDRVLRLPVARPTSVAFGGPALDELFVTTAREGLSAAELADQPLAGSVFRCSPGVQGVPVRPFAG